MVLFAGYVILFDFRIEIRRLEAEHSGGLEVETETESRDVLRQFELVDDGLLRAVENEFLVDAEMTVVELFVSSSFEYESDFSGRGSLNFDLVAVPCPFRGGIGGNARTVVFLNSRDVENDLFFQIRKRVEIAGVDRDASFLEGGLQQVVSGWNGSDKTNGGFFCIADGLLVFILPVQCIVIRFEKCGEGESGAERKCEYALEDDAFAAEENHIVVCLFI